MSLFSSILILLTNHRVLKIVDLWFEDCIYTEYCDGMKCFTLLQSAVTPESKLLLFPTFYSVCLGFIFLTLRARPVFVLCVVVVYQIWVLEIVNKARSCWWNCSAVIPGGIPCWSCSKSDG